MHFIHHIHVVHLRLLIVMPFHFLRNGQCARASAMMAPPKMAITPAHANISVNGIIPTDHEVPNTPKRTRIMTYKDILVIKGAIRALEADGALV